MNKVNIVVERLLREKPELRDNDHKLLAFVWHNMGMSLTPEQYQQFLTMPSAESVTRIRRALQKSGKYPSSERVRKYRNRKSLIVQQQAPRATVNQLENVLDNDYLERSKLL